MEILNNNNNIFLLKGSILQTKSLEESKDNVKKRINYLENSAESKA
jgi:chaperonin cofactor prefoldin